MKRPRRLLPRLALALLAPVLFLLAAEGVCRLLDAGYPTRFLIQSGKDGQAVWIDNQLFGYRFFAPSVSRAPWPIRLPRTRETGELRIVVLGESAAMGEPEPAFGPARLLELMLEDQYPGRPVRVINAAMTAINSHVIAEIARDLPRMMPDFVVLYIGNNEVVGPFGAGTVFTPITSSPRLARLRVLASRMRFSSVLRALAYRRDDADSENWKGMEMFSGFEVAQDDPRMETVYAGFRKNLSRIIGLVREAGAVPVLSTVAVNLSDTAPLDGTPHPAFSDESAADRSEAACRDALDRDRMRFRADSTINRIIRETAAAHPGVLLIDADADFSASRPPGNNVFLDHVHFNLTGSFMMADLIRKAIGATEHGDPAFDDITARAGWNPYTALEISQRIQERIARPPFTSAVNHRSLMLQWTAEIANRLRQIDVTGPADPLTNLKEQAGRRPDDEVYAALARAIYLYYNQFDDAARMVQLSHDRFPHRADIRGWMVIMQAIGGHPDRAWALMTEGAPPLGEIPADILISAAETLFESGYRRESAAVLEEASSRYPYRTGLQRLTAGRLAQAGDIGGALDRMRRLLDRNPDHHGLREEYGLMLTVSGRADEAVPYLSHLRDADAPEDRMKWAQFLLYRGDLPEARAHLEETVQRHPDDAAASRELAGIYMRTGRPVEAINRLQAAIRIEPWRGEDLALLGNLYDTVNRPAEAIRAYEQSLRIIEQPQEVMRSLAWMLATEGDPRLRQPRRALNIARSLKAMPGYDEDPYTMLVYAAALAANKQFEEALTETDAAISRAGTANEALASELIRSRELYARGEPIRISRDQDPGP